MRFWTDELRVEGKGARAKALAPFLFIFSFSNLSSAATLTRSMSQPSWITIQMAFDFARLFSTIFSISFSFSS
jgi:hypothetical protein